jgi:hypothetical protein
VLSFLNTSSILTALKGQKKCRVGQVCSRADSRMEWLDYFREILTIEGRQQPPSGWWHKQNGIGTEAAMVMGLREVIGLGGYLSDGRTLFNYETYELMI